MSAPDRHSTGDFARALSYAHRIGDELKKLGAWSGRRPPPEAFQSPAAFLADTLTFFEWLQFILVPRIQQVALEGGTFPPVSNVGVYAVKQLDGLAEAATLVPLLGEFDAFIEGLARKPAWMVKETVHRFLKTVPNQTYTELRQLEQDSEGWWAHVLLVVHTRRARETEFHAALRLVKAGESWEVDIPASVTLTARFRSERAAALSRQAADAFANGNAQEAQRLLGEAGQVANQPELTADTMKAREEPPPPRIETPRVHWEPIRLGQAPEPPPPPAVNDKPPQQTGGVDPEAAPPKAWVVAREFLEALARGGAHEGLSPNPIPPSGRDVELGERVFRTITSFEECFGEVEMTSEGPIVNAIVGAERGLWALRVALGSRQAQELPPARGFDRTEAGREIPLSPRQPEDLVERLYVEPQVSYLRTTDYYLRQHHIHPPFAGEGSARAFVMDFWHNLMTNRRDWAVKKLTPESREIELPACGHGWVDEIVWYIDHREEPLGVEVRVLMNTREQSRFWRTCAVYRAGEWMIDWLETLRRAQ